MLCMVLCFFLFRINICCLNLPFLPVRSSRQSHFYIYLYQGSFLKSSNIVLRAVFLVSVCDTGHKNIEY